MKSRAAAKPHGQLRRSQVVTTFGPGAMIDLPGQSVVVAGLEHWGGDPVQKGFQSIHEPRLLEKIRQKLERPEMRMYAPPVDVDLLREHVAVGVDRERDLGQLEARGERAHAQLQAVRDA